MKKKVNKFICILSMVIFLSSNMGIAMENIKLPQNMNEKIMKEVKVYVNDKNYNEEGAIKQLEVIPYINDNCFMVPINFVMELAGISKDSISWDEVKKMMTIFKGQKIIQIEVDSNILVIDGEKITMGTDVEMKDGHMMVPLKSIGKVLNLSIKKNHKATTASIFIEKEQVKEDRWDYTYENLLERALKNSRDLKSAEMDIERTEIIRDDANDDTDAIPLSYGVGAAELPANAAYLKFSKADFEHQLAEKGAKKIKEKIAYDVKDAYYNVLKSEDNKKLAKMGLALMSEKKHLIDLNNREGFASDIEKRQIQREYEEAKKQYNLGQKELEKAYDKLNHLVGLDIKERYILKDELIFEKDMNEDVDIHILRTIENSSDIWALEKIIRLKDLDVNLHVFNLDMRTKWSFGIDPYDAKEIDAKMAEVKLGKAKQQYEKSLRELYVNLSQLKEQYEKEVILYEKAKDDLKIAKLNVEVGNELPIIEKKAILQLEKIKKQLREKIMIYNKVTMVYEKPWIMNQKENKKEE
ncbi:MAG: stalk domain-containing protein [Marinisporobacter sp.]|nr:stalk domain-containing protein [Marinisporobacter sp.]